MSKDNIQVVELDLGEGNELTFNVERKAYIDFLNSSTKNPFNAMQNLLASTVSDQSSAQLTPLLTNPANVPELAGALLEEYKPDISVTVKKRKPSQTALAATVTA